MDRANLRKLVEQRLQSDETTIHFDDKSEQLRVELIKSGKGVTLSLPELLQHYHEKGEPALDQALVTIERGLKAMSVSPHLKGKEKRIFPVLRSASFPEKTKDGRRLIAKAHTAETKILYALDLGNACRLIDDRFLEQEGIAEQMLMESAAFNLNALPVKMKKDVVRNNAFYFINTNDGYDASRILNRKLIEKMRSKAHGDLTVAVPHQDVLIFGDIVNPEGYDILAQMTMKFYTSGTIPITMMPFIFNEQGELEPIFIMANKRPKPGKTKKQ
ncbi:DUF1444 family protein [Sporolactobacillus inulinus]|jgi:uncharacterized protein YtpQ (UPF0354 family)|uniref:Uncharacterized protein n=1 Tax=Sporolactobacillus inulinus CASD TaxID=1069536 RepID=A0A0U1QPX0_9BACL|nr:DUF1444 family protein [Sporolactobacillus inulinus]KLI02849.1 hypothetical protein SINU_05880 [Sporolactobacillus inulinus CASD]GEB75744.1 UPF0354 protein YtpQ [Sporolactobacillus inulinus]